MQLIPTNTPLIRDLKKILRPDQVSAADPERLSYGRDANSKAILWVRSNQVKYPPDAVVWPENTDEVSRIARFANEQSLPLVAFGGGTGVCGGTWALKGGIALDFKRMGHILKVDGRQMTVSAQTGVVGEILERELNRRGLTLGHFPASIYAATLGGFLACRSAGQYSSLYGKIEDMVEAMEVVLADGEVIQIDSVRDKPGVLDLKELFLGSEGTLGLMTQAKLKIHPLPQNDFFLSFSFSSLERGSQAMAKILQAGLAPALLRLYDPLDTLLYSSRPTLHWVKDCSLKLALKRPAWLMRGLEMLSSGSLLVLSFQGTESLSRVQAEEARKICLEFKGKDGGEKPGREWLAHRYSVSYKLSPIFDEGFFADTMEVATTWKNLPHLYQSVRRVMGEDSLVLAHFSHAYPEGCSIYFTFLGYQQSPENSEALYDKIWAKALGACVAAGGTISHHHGVGILKAAFMKEEWGPAFEWLKKIKQELDPKNILNPGKLGF